MWHRGLCTDIGYHWRVQDKIETVNTGATFMLNARKEAMILRLKLVFLITIAAGLALSDGLAADVQVDPSGGYFPLPESQGGWRKLHTPEDVRAIGGMDPASLDELRLWLLQSDKRNFAAVVIRRGWIVLEVERGNSARTDARCVASVSKAVCATVLAIASEQSRKGLTPRKITFDDAAFDFIPWAQPLGDPRKAKITVKQLFNRTSGICPEATGAPNDGTWEYVLGHTGDPRTARLAFDPGKGCGYSTHALHHASLVCETVTGKPYDRFAVEALFRPIGCEHWWFQYFGGGEGIGRHPTHGLGMPARDLARIAYCMLRGGRWGDRQVIPAWFVEETAAATHDVRSPEMRWGLNPQTFSHGWQLPAWRAEASAAGRTFRLMRGISPAPAVSLLHSSRAWTWWSPVKRAAADNGRMRSSCGGRVPRSSLPARMPGDGTDVPANRVAKDLIAYRRVGKMCGMDSRVFSCIRKGVHVEVLSAIAARFGNAAAQPWIGTGV